MAPVGLVAPGAVLEAGPVVGERRQAGFLWGDLALVLSLGFVLFSFIGGVLAYFVDVETTPPSPAALWTAVSLNAFIFILLPSVWVLTTVHGGWPGARRYLGMTGGWGDAGIGVGLGLVLVMVFGGAAFLLDKAGLAPDNAPITDTLANITLPLAIVFSAVAGLGEEILFRGVLQRWLRWWGQGLVFGALHFANAGLFAVAIVGTIGLLFGYLRHRGVSLWTLILSHFVYNLVLLSTAIFFPDIAEGSAVLW